MTISSTVSEVEYAGDDVSTVFPIPFIFDTAADLKVIQTDPDGNPVVLSSGFSISGGIGATGSLTLTAALATDYSLTILDDPERSQLIDYINNDSFPAESAESGFDRNVRLIKRMHQLFKKSVRVDDGDPASGAGTLLGSVDNRKGKYLFFNAITGAIEYAVAIASQTLSQSIIAQFLNPQTTAEASAGVTPTNFEYEPFNVLRYGADNTGVTSSTTALDNAIRSAGLGNHNTITVPHGSYLFSTAPAKINYGIMIKGEGSQGAVPTTFGTQFEFDYNTSNGLEWDGNGADNRGVGGGIKNITLVVRSGKSLGDMIKVLATSTTRRPGEMVFENVLVHAEPTAEMTRGLHIDGTAANDVGNKGVRSVRLAKFRVADCTTDNEYIRINQGLHVFSSYLEIDNGDGSGITGMTIDGDSTDIFLTGCEINGNLIVGGSSSMNMTLGGRISNLDINNENVLGAACIQSTGITNTAKQFRISSNISDAFYAKRTTTQVNVTGDGTVTDITYDSETFDKNGSFVPSTGIFTAKIAGIYQFNAHVLYSGVLAAHTNHDTTLLHRDSGSTVVNTVTVINDLFTLANASGNASVSISTQLELSEADTVKVQAAVSGGTKVVGVFGAATTYTNFSGHLLA